MESAVPLLDLVLVGDLVSDVAVDCLRTLHREELPHDVGGDSRGDHGCHPECSRFAFMASLG